MFVDASKSVEAADPVPVDSAAVLVVGGLDEDAPKPDLLTVTNAYTSCGASVELMKQLEQASAAGVGAYSLPKIEKKDSNCLTSLLR